MSDPARPTNSPDQPNLHAALLEFFKAPGKHQLQLREPVPLFASIREVLQIAAGRAGELPAHEAAALQEAATFFIRAALLFPGADHYAVMGLAPRSESADLKERYRLLMRLIHPDFAGSSSLTWPSDAAVRVNRAYEVLSSTVLRREYDEQLARGPVPRPAAKRPPPPRAVVAHDNDDTRTKLRRSLAWVLGAGGALLGAMLLFGRPEPVQLVQRPEEPVAPPQPASRPVMEEISAAIAEATNLLRSATLTPPQPSVAPTAPAPARPLPARTVVAATVQPAPPTSPWTDSPVQRASVVAAEPAPASPVALIPSPPPAPAPAPRPEPIAAAPAPAGPAPVAVAAPLPAAQQVAAAPRAPVATAIPAPTLHEVQPLLTQLLERMESGSGEQMLRLLATSERNSASAQSLQRQYDLLVRGARKVHLAQVEFISEPRGPVLAVTSRVRLHTGEPTVGSYGERFAVRAEFASRDGRVVLTSLSGASD